MPSITQNPDAGVTETNSLDLIAWLQGYVAVSDLISLSFGFALVIYCIVRYMIFRIKLNDWRGKGQVLFSAFATGLSFAYVAQFCYAIATNKQLVDVLLSSNATLIIGSLGFSSISSLASFILNVESHKPA